MGMKTHTKASAAIALIAAGVLPLFALPAQADTTSTTATAATVTLTGTATTVTSTPAVPIVSSSEFLRHQLALEHQIIARQVQLALLGTNLADAANVTSSDRTALATVITNEQSALATDATNAAAATTETQLQAIRQAMLQDERVYAVVSGQVGLVIQADNETVTETGYAGLVSELKPLVTEMGSNGAANLLNNITSEVTAATSLTTGVSADALGLTPSGYPGNESQIKTWEFQLNQAQRDLGIARNDVKRIEAIALGLHRLPIRKAV